MKILVETREDKGYIKKQNICEVLITQFWCCISLGNPVPSSAKEWALGCVNWPPRPEAVRTWDHATKGPLFCGTLCTLEVFSYLVQYQEDFHSGSRIVLVTSIKIKSSMRFSSRYKASQNVFRFQQTWIAKLRDAQEIWKRTLQTTIFKNSAGGNGGNGCNGPEETKDRQASSAAPTSPTAENV